MVDDSIKDDDITVQIDNISELFNRLPKAKQDNIKKLITNKLSIFEIDFSFAMNAFLIVISMSLVKLLKISIVLLLFPLHH